MRLPLHYHSDRPIDVRRAVQGLWEAVEQRQVQGGFVRVVESSIELGDIKALLSAISSLLEVFQVCYIMLVALFSLF